MRYNNLSWSVTLDVHANLHPRHLHLTREDVAEVIRSLDELYWVRIDDRVERY